MVDDEEEAMLALLRRWRIMPWCYAICGDNQMLLHILYHSGYPVILVFT